jgi:hypothetical protein
MCENRDITNLAQMINEIDPTYGVQSIAFEWLNSG